MADEDCPRCGANMACSYADCPLDWEAMLRRTVETPRLSDEVPSVRVVDRDMLRLALAEIDRLRALPGRADVPVDGRFRVGDPVSKVGGDYRFDGVVVAAFPKRSGAIRYVVEDDRGVLHIYADGNLHLMGGRP
jgi:hypothetical protein